MILFLDIVSLLPEFSLIKDNKIIFSKKILNNEEKISDSILPVFLELDKEFKFKDTLSHLIACTGPGSYTALRLGIAFFSGLSISMKIPFIGITCVDLFQFLLPLNEKPKSVIYILSSNNQKFICIFDKSLKSYKINKIDNDQSIFIFDENFTKKFLTNDVFFNNQSFFKKDIQLQKIHFKEIVNEYLNEILLIPQPKIIEPIYISNNLILN